MKNLTEEENTLRFILNTELNKQNLNEFKKSVVNLKKNFGKEITTEFLNNLIEENPLIKDNRKRKNDIIYKALKKNGFKTEIRFITKKELTRKGFIQYRKKLNFILVEDE